MNLVVLFLVSQTLSASLSTAKSLFGLFEQPWLQLDTESPGSPRVLLASESPGSPSQLRGYMENCYPNSSYNFSWEPKDIDPHGPLKMFINYSAPADVDSIEWSFDIKYRFIHVIMNPNITCAKIPHLCYLKKGGAVKNLIYPVEDVIYLNNFKGTFKVKVSAENKNHENLICVIFKANVL